MMKICEDENFAPLYLLPLANLPFALPGHKILCPYVNQKPFTTASHLPNSAAAGPANPYDLSAPYSPGNNHTASSPV
jgi:hypothetical protein